MTLRTWIKITALLFVILGIITAVYAPLLMPLFNGGVSSDALAASSREAHLFDVGTAFMRLVGTLLLTAGIVIWYLRDVITLYERRLALGMFIGLGAAAVISFIETVTSWRYAGAGWVLTVLFALLAAGFAYGALFPTVVVPPPDDIVELEVDIHRRHDAEEHTPPPPAAG